MSRSELSSSSSSSSSNNNNNNHNNINHNHRQLHSADEESEKEPMLWFDALANEYKPVVFGVIAQQADSPFFSIVQKGCEEQARKLGVICHFVGPPQPRAEMQAQVFQDLLSREGVQVQGIAISSLNDEILAPLIHRAMHLGIPVITFDSDNAKSSRLSYIGTDNYAFGQTLGKILWQLRPLGGTFAMISTGSPNSLERNRGVRDYLATSPWVEAPSSPSDCHGSVTLALDQMLDFTSGNTNNEDPVDDIHAIVSVGGWPMFDVDDPNRWKHIVVDNPNTTFVVADTLPIQIDLLMAGYVHGLVGQDPYSMGTQSIKVLSEYFHRYHHDTPTSSFTSAKNPVDNNNTTRYENIIHNHNHHHRNNPHPVPDQIYGTSFFEMVRVPMELPPLQVDFNDIASLRYLGLTFFTVTAVCAMVMAVWTCHKRSERVVVASQPHFLYLIIIGVLVFSSTLIPLSTIDNHEMEYHESYSLLEGTTTAEDNGDVDVVDGAHDPCDGKCMILPWTSSMGFTLMFTALYSKTRRINQIFHNPNPHVRMRLSNRDVFLPLIVLMVLNVINLTCWTIMAPLHYTRENHSGTDGWNRVISSYGTCKTYSEDNALPFVIIMAVLNIGVLIIANWQAYEAREIQSEFAESKNIAIAMFCILQAALIGIPVLLLVREQPQVYYVVFSFMIFIISMSILLLIFVPKMHHEKMVRLKAKIAKKQHLVENDCMVKELRLKFGSLQVNEGSEVMEGCHVPFEDVHRNDDAYHNDDDESEIHDLEMDENHNNDKTIVLDIMKVERGGQIGRSSSSSSSSSSCSTTKQWTKSSRSNGLSTLQSSSRTASIPTMEHTATTHKTDPDYDEEGEQQQQQQRPATTGARRDCEKQTEEEKSAGASSPAPSVVVAITSTNDMAGLGLSTMAWHNEATSANLSSSGGGSRQRRVAPAGGGRGAGPGGSSSVSYSKSFSGRSFQSMGSSGRSLTSKVSCVGGGGKEPSIAGGRGAGPGSYSKSFSGRSFQSMGSSGRSLASKVSCVGGGGKEISIAGGRGAGPGSYSKSFSGRSFQSMGSSGRSLTSKVSCVGGGKEPSP